VAGKIVLTSSDGPGRGEKYSAAAAAGAAGFIFHNAQPGLLASTGSIRKDLPGIGLAYEHAARIQRLLENGPVQAHLQIQAVVKTVTARNIIAEIPGSDPSQGWILACGHYDGHDISQGALDNAAASAILVEAARLLAPHASQLKVGIRFVLFSGEELGLFGSYAYAQRHAAELDPIRLVFNADVVAQAMPLTLRTQASPALAEYLRGLPLNELDAEVNDGPRAFIMNSDHFPFSLAGLNAVWAVTSHPESKTSWVHTMADTLDKVEPRLLRQTAGTIVRLLLRMATEPEQLPRGRKTPAEIKRVLTEAGFEKSLRASGKWPFPS
jgi:Zn-dependent M28 family amino/carboxypeptidase